MPPCRRPSVRSPKRCYDEGDRVTFQQLALPFEEDAATGPARGIKRARRVFVNRDLRLTGAAYVGFDMDYTLAIYDQPEMDHLSIQATAQKLLKRGYP